MIDLSTETPLSLSEVCALLPPGRRGRRPHFSCVLRWITIGAKALDGRRVRLRAARCGGRWFSSKEAVTEFVQALTPDLDKQPLATSRTKAQISRAAGRAARALEQIGI